MECLKWKIIVDDLVKQKAPKKVIEAAERVKTVSESVEDEFINEANEYVNSEIEDIYELVICGNSCPLCQKFTDDCLEGCPLFPCHDEDSDYTVVKDYYESLEVFHLLKGEREKND